MGFDSIDNEEENSFEESLDSLQKGDEGEEGEEESLSMAAGTYQLPIPNGEYKEFGGYYTQSMEALEHPKGHEALDVFAPGMAELMKNKEFSKATTFGKGETVFPIGSGLVVQVGSGGKSGNFCVIEHPQDPGMYSFYAHLDKVNVTEGTKVSAKTPIGLNGKTGSAKKTSPHVHLEIWTIENSAGTSPVNAPKKKLNPETIIGKSYGSIKKKSSTKADKIYKLASLFDLLVNKK